MVLSVHGGPRHGDAAVTPADAPGPFGATLSRSPPGDPVLKSAEEGELCTRTTGVVSHLFSSRFWPEDCDRQGEMLPITPITIALNFELLRPLLCVKYHQNHTQRFNPGEMHCAGGISRGCCGLEGNNFAALALAPIPLLAANLGAKG